MVIDRTHRNWALASGTVCALATVSYVATAHAGDLRPFGGTPAGIVFGAAAFALMVFAVLLGLRKKFLGQRIGRLQTWMRGHIWLGLLSAILVILHAGFRTGGALTATLVALTVIVALSGVAGTLLQHAVPRILTREVPMETVFEQIPNIRAQLCEEAQHLVTAATTVGVVKTATQGNTALAVVERTSQQVVQPLQSFWETQLAPFLAEPDSRSILAKGVTSEAAFRHLRTMLPAEMHTTVASMETLAEEARQLRRQERLHYLLHAWLFFHVPVSYGLIALAVVHAWRALRY